MVEANKAEAMTNALRTEVGNQMAIRQIRSRDGLRVLSTVESSGGYRFIEEQKVHELAGPGFDAYWNWRIDQESGIYRSEGEAFEDAMKSILWVKDVG